MIMHSNYYILSSFPFTMKNKKDQDVEQFLEDFFSLSKKHKKNLTLEDIKKSEDESYDLP